MIAVISDIHGNLEALRAVLADIDGRGVTRIFCLGDVVGYGPDPRACFDLVQARAEIMLCGNHEHAMLNGTIGYNRLARETIEYARQQLQPGRWAWPRTRRRWQAVTQLPVDYLEGGIYYCHASPRDPINEYILAQDCRNAVDKLREIFGMIDGLCLVGHTHAPGVLDDRFKFREPAQLGMKYQAGEGEKAVINVGSVGQPRDGDNRSCYVLFEPVQRAIEYVRVEYDFHRTIRKIGRFEELAEVLATRLEKGV